MKQKINRNFFAILAISLCVAVTQARAIPLRIVTTLSSYQDIAKTIGGERVEASAIASPRFNPHFIEPRPSDVLKLKRSDLFIHSGLDLEAWRAPLVDAAARSELREGGQRQLDLSEGISILEVPKGQVSRAEGDIHASGNPHYWVDPRNGMTIARSIANKLSEIDPDGAVVYQGNFSTFRRTLEQKMSEWGKLLAPFKGQELIGYHDEWPYLMEYAGLAMLRFIEPKPGIPPGPQYLSELGDYIKSHNVKALAQTSYFPSDAGDYLSKGTGIKVLSLCQNVGELPDCGDYISMVDYNIHSIVNGLVK